MANSGGGGRGSAAIRAGRAFVEIFAEDSKLQRALKRAERQVREFGKRFREAGIASAAAGTAALAPLAGAFKSVLDRDVEMGRLAKRFGDTTEGFSELAYAAEASGVPMEQLGDILENLPERIYDAATAGGEAGDIFAKLGIDAGEFLKLPLSERFAALADGMKDLDATSKAALLGKLFSDKGQMLGELFEGGSGKLRGLMADARVLGQSLPAEQAERSAEAARELNRAWTAGQSIFRALGAALVPPKDSLDDLVATIVRSASSVREFISTNKSVIQTAAGVAAAVTGAGVALVGVGAVASGVAGGIGAVSAGLSLVGTVAAAAATPLGIITLAAAGAGYAFFTLTDAGKAAGESISRYFGESVDTATATWQGLSDALKSGDLSLAGRVAMAGLDVEFRRGLLTLTDQWNEFKGFFVDGWHDAVFLVESAWNDATTSIAKGIVDLLASIQGRLARGVAGIFAVNASLAEAAGLDSLAGDLRDLARASTNAAADPRATKAELERQRSEEENRLFAERRAAQEAANAARVADRADAVAALGAAREALAAAVAEAAEMAKRIGQAKPNPLVPAGLPSATMLSGLTRGAFDGPFRQIFGNGTSLGERQVKVAERQVKVLEQIRDGALGKDDLDRIRGDGMGAWQ